MSTLVERTCPRGANLTGWMLLLRSKFFCATVSGFIVALE